LLEYLAAAPRCRIVRRDELERLEIDDRLRSARLVAVSTRDELQLAEDVRAWGAARGHPGPVWRLFGDLFVTISTGDGEWLESPPVGATASGRRVYAIVCTPRSGSTMLADLLTATGACGRPREHVRYPVLGLLEQTRFDVHRWVASLLSAGSTPNGVFGTKLISHFLFRAQEALTQGDWERLRELCPESRLILLYRRNRVEQAISAYVARETTIYFAPTPEMQARRDDALRALRYDFEPLERLYRNFRRQEQRLRTMVEQSGLETLPVDYEDLLEDQTATLARILRFLDVPVPDDLADLKSTVAKLRNEQTDALANRFREDLHATGRV
jgi:LPS sulfotransferase NodH